MTASQHRRSGEADAARVREALLKLPAIDGCTVVTRGSEQIAYVTSTATVSSDALRARLGDLLPDAPLPTVVPVSRIPLTADGAVDVGALSAVPIVDADVVARLESAIRAADVGPSAVVLEERAEPALWLHQVDILPAGQHALRANADASATKQLVADADGVTRRPAIVDGGPITLAPDAPATMTEALLRAAARDESIGIRLIDIDGQPESFLSYRALLADARRVLSGLDAAGFRPGDKVILHTGSLGELFVSFWACVLGGILPITVSAAPAYNEENGVLRKLRSTWNHLERPPILTSDRLESSVRNLETLLGMEGIRVHAFGALRAHPPREKHREPAPTDIMFLQLTSGSTGASKCVQETHTGVVHDVTTYGLSRKQSSETVSLNWFPMDHVLPFMYHHVACVFFACQQIHVATASILSAPLRWLDLIAAHRATQTWSPNFGLKLVNDALGRAPDRTWDLASMRSWITAGEQVTVPVVRELFARVGPMGLPPRALHPAYGMTECSIVYQDEFDFENGVHAFTKASLSGVLVPAKLGEDGAQTFVHVGRPHQGVTVRIVDAENRIIPEGIIGRIQARRPVVAPRYYPDLPITPELAEEGWIDTGDRGFLRDGCLTITGREKEMIIVRGHNVFCHEIEEVVGRIPGVENTFVAACATQDPDTGTEGVCVFFVPSAGDLSTTIRSINSRVTAELGITPSYALPLAPKDFPRTTSGKVQRTLLRKALEAGQFQVAIREADLTVRNANTCPDWFYRRQWRPARPTDGAEDGSKVLAFAEGSFARTFAELGWIVVEPGTSFERTSDSHYRIAPGNAGDYAKLLEELAGRDALPDRVVHAWSCAAAGSRPTDWPSLDAAQRLGTYSVLMLFQALDRVATRAVKLWVVTRHAQAVRPDDEIVIERASLPGLVRSAAQGIHWLKARVVDLPLVADPVRDAAWLRAELATTQTDRDVAYRDGVRLVPRLVRAPLTREAPGDLGLAAGSIALLAGGLGGVGTLVARTLVARSVRVVLVGRTELPAREQWPDLVTAGDDVAQKISTILALEKTGEVRYEVADVADLAQLEAAAARAESAWGGKVGAVFHLAGAFAERALLEETPERFADQLRTPAGGALALGTLAAERGARFVAFSSVTGMLGSATAAGFAAGNSFIDAVVHERHGHGFAWSPWHEIGKRRGGARTASEVSGMIPIRARQGMISMLAGLCRPPGTLLVGLDGESRALRGIVEGAAAPIAKPRAYVDPKADVSRLASVTASDCFGATVACEPVRFEGLPLAADGSVDRKALAERLGRRDDGRNGALQSDIEKRIAAIWKEVLSVDEVGADDNFFDLGGSSLLLVGIVAKLETAFGRKISTMDMFQHSTVRAMAKFLSGAAEFEMAALVATSMSRGQKRRQVLLPHR